MVNLISILTVAGVFWVVKKVLERVEIAALDDEEEGGVRGYVLTSKDVSLHRTSSPVTTYNVLGQPL